MELMKSIIFLGLVILGAWAISSVFEFSSEYDWKDDGVILMRHSVTAEYGCFGCNNPVSGPALCVDPSIDMVLVNENSKLYCNGNFRIIGLE